MKTLLVSIATTLLFVSCSSSYLDDKNIDCKTKKEGLTASYEGLIKVAPNINEAERLRKELEAELSKICK